MCGRDEVVREANDRERDAIAAGLSGQGTGEPYTGQQPKIADRCPTCGAKSLFVGAGGWLTCGVIGCKEPGVSVAIEALRTSIPNQPIQLVGGIVRPVPWPGDGHHVHDTHEALLLGLERLRAAAEPVRLGINSDPTAWWNGIKADMERLTLQLEATSRLLAQLEAFEARIESERPHA